jgi:hypothetical protein
MKKIEKYIPILVMIIIAVWSFNLGEDWQKEKEVKCLNINLDSKLICGDCQAWTYGDTLKFIDRNNNLKLYLVK